MILKAGNLHFSYSEKPILNGINLEIRQGECVGLLGPNGVGKTTLIRCLLGFLKQDNGTVTVDGKDISEFSGNELAKTIAYIPQSYNPVFNHSVLDTVLMGVTNSLGLFEHPSSAYIEKSLKALEMLSIEDLANRGSQKISGGERQLMLIARAIVQDAKILIMDEPTSNLDMSNSYKVIQTVRKLADSGYSVLISSHNPSQILSFCSRIVALKDGKILSDTSPVDITDEILTDLYGIPLVKCNNCSSVVMKSV